jgi:hypothetical protein
MTTLLWFIGCFCAGIALISFVYFVRNRNRKSMSKGWKVGDVIILNSLETSTNLLKEMNKNNISTVTLCGWNEDNVFYKIGTLIYCESWKSVDVNKSQVWRDNVNKCTEFMGTEPGFNSRVEPETPNETSGTIDGEPIETMNEIMCQIHLKKAIEEENYELADKLRKRLENFR